MRISQYLFFSLESGKGLKILNLGELQTAAGVAAVLQNTIDVSVDPYLEDLKNQAGNDESDEEVIT
jgi:structure-specific recognition protein 1